MRNVICYVDGFNLYHGVRSKGWRKYYWLDLWKLAEHYLLQNQELKELVYCTAAVKKNPPSRKRQRAYIDALCVFRPNTKVIYGHYLAKDVRCVRCGYTYLHHEEKMTDVNIANQLLLDAMDGRFDTALLISGDSDLVPPIRTIRNRFPEKRIITVCPPNRVSKYLKNASHGFRTICETDLRQAQLPENVTVGKKGLLIRPSPWV
jgi:uncharacterized LabA/DUF88 family protein